VGPGHLGSLTEPAVVVGSFADSLQEHRGALMTGSDLGRRPSNGVLGPVHARFLGRRGWDFLRSVVLGVLVPSFFRMPELLRHLEL